MQTDFPTRCLILADLWANYRDSEAMKDFVEFNDLGLPLAYMASEKLCTVEDSGVIYINETFDMLLAAVDIEDEGFITLDDLLNRASFDLGE